MRRRCILGLSGFILVMIGGITSFTWDAILDFIIAKELPLKPDSLSFKLWKDPEVPIRLNVYFFNWTNPEQIYDSEFKPNFVEIGPYVFREYYMKVNFTWNENNTVSYNRKRYWHFEEENSVGRLEDNITTLNPIALSAAYISRNRNIWIRLTVSSVIKMSQQKISVTRTVGTFLFSGYSDVMLTLTSAMPVLFSKDNSAKFDKFAWYYKRNGSEAYDGVYNMDTGADDVRKIGRMREWNHRNRTNAYKGETGKLYYKEDREVMGVPGYLYVGTRSFFDSGESDNWCLCDGECVPYGAINISACQYGSPIFTSYPHFLYAHPSYLEKVQGLKPSETKHRFEMTIDPKTGIILEGKIRMQVNVLLQPYNNIQLFNGVPKMLFPMIWVENNAIVHNEYADLLKTLQTIHQAGLYSSIGVLLLGLSVMIIAFLLWKLNKKSEGKISADKNKYNALKTMKYLIFRKKKLQVPVNAEEHDLIKIKESNIIIK
ncbi:hypothetical protein C0J52_15657 [Blattella germanica]|nr:hypothetical protein C0J52_15657 [Blattella germanica]